ncbi:MAG: CDP-alcohol phosphatidyltransferase family protein [Gemmatimonadota bacterium]|nr:CDP-alcohol phosphatidyltransferase family protein [Gemmatimonadota bacterium]MDH5803787.1 CDP-alcohol phosphatidyltransferase family protein [Gemmatimonadota bacterium]
MATEIRELTFLLAKPEKKVLRAIAGRIPEPINSDHLTLLGVLASLLTGLAYAMTRYDPVWFWVASLGLFLNWFGDSLDGTLARVRRAERPKYGFYLDHAVDGLSILLVGLGIGLSGFVGLEWALAMVTMYLLLSINVYLETLAYGRFDISYGKIGPTEARIILIGVNTVMAFEGARISAGFLNPVFIVGVTGMFLMLSVRFYQNLKKLASLDPPVRRVKEPLDFWMEEK